MGQQQFRARTEEVGECDTCRYLKVYSTLGSKISARSWMAFRWSSCVKRWWMSTFMPCMAALLAFCAQVSSLCSTTVGAAAAAGTLVPFSMSFSGTVLLVAAGSSSILAGPALAAPSLQAIKIGVILSVSLESEPSCMPVHSSQHTHAFS